MMFGFGQMEYEVSEYDGFVSVDIVFAFGLPGDYQPVVLMSTNNGTAIGKILY